MKFNKDYEAQSSFKPKFSDKSIHLYSGHQVYNFWNRFYIQLLCGSLVLISQCEATACDRENGEQRGIGGHISMEVAIFQ